MNHVVRWESYGGYWKRTDQHHRETTIKYRSTMVSIQLCASTQQATHSTMVPFAADLLRLNSIFQDVYGIDDGPSNDTRYRTAEHSDGERGIVALASMVGMMKLRDPRHDGDASWLRTCQNKLHAQ